MRKFFVKSFGFLCYLLLVISSIHLFNKVLLNVSAPLVLDRSTNKIILGDSHGQYAFNDDLISGTKNLSNSADSYFYSYLKLRHILKHNPQLDTVFLSFAQHNVDKIIEERWLLNRTHLQNRMKLYFPLFHFEDILFLARMRPQELFKGFFSQSLFPYKLMAEKNPFGGYQDLGRNILSQELERLKNKNSRDSLLFDEAEIEKKYLFKIVDLCYDNNKTLILVNTPIHSVLKQNQSEIYNFYNRYLSETIFLDFTSLDYGDKYFGDLVHLNSDGAKAFSQFFDSLNTSDILSYGY